jgi:hypothetical protein
VYPSPHRRGPGQATVPRVRVPFLMEVEALNPAEHQKVAGSKKGPTLIPLSPNLSLPHLHRAYDLGLHLDSDLRLTLTSVPAGRGIRSDKRGLWPTAMTWGCLLCSK